MNNDGHNHSTTSKNLIWSIGINIIIVITELILGVLARSMALISDALHNFADVGSMTLSWWGEKVSAQPNTNQKTYGYKRAEIIIAFINAAVLLGVSGLVLVESIMRLFHPENVVGSTMFFMAIVALIGNGIATYLLQTGADKNLNLKSAWLHSMQDALFSLGVVIGAIIIYYTGWNWVDPIISIVVSIFLLKEVYEILVESVNMLMDSVPKDLDFDEIKKSITRFKGIKNVNDLHIWQTGSEDRFLSAHLLVEEISGTERIKILAEVMELLKEKYEIHHSTLQIVSEQEIKEIGLECEHCN